MHLAVADRETPGWEIQKRSAARYGGESLLNLVKLPQPFRFSMKLDVLKSFLRSIPENPVIFMIDALDVIYNNSFYHIFADFNSKANQLGTDSFGRRTQIMFNGERNCWPHAEWRQRFPEKDLATPLPFLNSGVLLGYKDAILKILDLFPWDQTTDDQAYWISAYLSSLQDSSIPRIEIDHDASIACCFFQQPLTELFCKDRVIRYKSSGVRPAILHFNGPTKSLIPSLAKQLGY